MSNAVPERRTFPKGTVIFKEGERGDNAYLLQSGAVRMFKTISGKRITIGIVRPFQIFGELALLDEGSRMAAALVEEDATCMVLSKASIRDMLDSAPPGLGSVIQSMLGTMRVMGDELAVAKARLLDAGVTE